MCSPLKGTLVKCSEREFTTFANNQMIFMESPTNRIKEVLAEKGIKQTWLAEKLGRSFTIVNPYVCNRRQPSLELLLFGGRIVWLCKL